MRKLESHAFKPTPPDSKFNVFSTATALRHQSCYWGVLLQRMYRGHIHIAPGSHSQPLGNFLTVPITQLLEGSFKNMDLHPSSHAALRDNMLVLISDLPSLSYHSPQTLWANSPQLLKMEMMTPTSFYEKKGNLLD